MKPGDDLYLKARGILRGEPAMGKKRLADRLGVKTPTSRRLIWRFRGETQGHSTDPVYQNVRKLKEANLDWGPRRIAQELHISEDHAMMYLARWIGAQAFQATPGTTAEQSATATTVDGPNAGSTLQDAVTK